MSPSRTASLAIGIPTRIYMLTIFRDFKISKIRPRLGTRTVETSLACQLCLRLCIGVKLRAACHMTRPPLYRVWRDVRLPDEDGMRRGEVRGGGAEGGGASHAFRRTTTT